MKLIQKRDVIVVFVLLLMAVVFYTGFLRKNKAAPLRAELYYGNERIKIIELNTGEDKRFSVSQNENVVFHLYADGSICFEESDCPDQFCVHAGKLRQLGESAACLPNKMILKLVRAEEYEADSVDLIQ